MSLRIRPHVCALLATALLVPAAGALSADERSVIQKAPAANQATKAVPSPNLETAPAAVKRNKAEPAPSETTRDAATKTDVEAMKPEVRKPEMSEATKKAMKMMLPDLQVEIEKPSSSGQPVTLKFHNKGSKATPVGFTVVTTLEAACEAGKLTSPISTPNGEESVQPIPAGSFRYVFVQPSSGSWGGGGCYVRVVARADSWGIVAETDETNNKAFATFCPGNGSCY